MCADDPFDGNSARERPIAGGRSEIYRDPVKMMMSMTGAFLWPCGRAFSTDAKDRFRMNKPLSALLVPQDNEGVDFGCAASRQPGGDSGDREQERTDACVGERIGVGDAEE